MSNSKLVSYTKISPNKTSPRNHCIDTVTIHCYVGQASVESAGNWFGKSTTQASCNYMIGADGRIALIVDEGDRSWCSSNRENDHRAITIECASDKTHPYAVNDKVYASLINLLVDICERNENIKELRWLADKSLIGQVSKQNMTVHRWFKNKACPGEYLYSRHSQIANEVNARLRGGNTPNVKPTITTMKSIEEVARDVIAGKYGNGEARKIAIKNAGYEYSQVQAKVNEILGVSNKTSNNASNNASNNTTNTSNVTSNKKSISEIAKEVIAGKWGNGTDRQNRLKNAGYDYSAVQAEVNRQLGVNKTSSTVTSKKSIDTIAREVIAGKWGNGTERKQRLTAAGYDYNAVQKRVNQLLK